MEVYALVGFFISFLLNLHSISEDCFNRCQLRDVAKTFSI